MRRLAPLVLALALLPVGGTRPGGLGAAAAADSIVTLSIVATTDLHGNVFARDGRGGLALLAGYVNNLRAARALDGGAVLLIDTGDTFQGGVESNLSEGAIVVDAYNSLGYTAAVIGNHEFDFGPIDTAGARQALNLDPRGALKARAAQARFPFLAANLVDESTGRPVDWPNVRPSVLVDAAGVKVGIVGIMSIDALRATLAVNVAGLRVAPLSAAVADEATKLRAAGAEVVIVGAHAGGACESFGDPADLSSCHASSEIFELARSLPHGLVNVIVAGHTHQAVAHEVEGIAIVQAYALGRSFARVDLAFDRRARRAARHEIFAPREVCARQDAATLTCDAGAATDAALPQARYERLLVTADRAIAAAMAPALARVRSLQALPLGVVLETPLERSQDAESPLGNLFADALRATSGADVAINNNFRGGLRADLPRGPLTFGRLYDVFPFDNRLVKVTLSGAQLQTVLTAELRRNPRALAISGVRVRAACSAQGPRLALLHSSGRPIGADERLVVVGMDSLIARTVFAALGVPPGFHVSQSAPVLRESVEDWLRRQNSSLDVNRFVDAAAPRWEFAGVATGC